MFNNIYKGKRVMVTGHAGFKGSWLTLWLRKLGATVIECGNRPSTEPNHHDILRLPGAVPEKFVDLRGRFRVEEIVRLSAPDLVIHLAAKAIVARSFRDPQETFENNVMGAANVLDAVRHCPSVKGVVLITTDKVYEDQNWQWGYRENDSLGGSDPYSASKVCVEQVARCYQALGMNIAVARAGNVVGGGDWSEARLIPDIMKAAANGVPVIVKTPTATRPWQHVLDALQGYLLMGQGIFDGRTRGTYNFGPSEQRNVTEVLEVAREAWDAVTWRVEETEVHPHMVNLLRLDSTRARLELDWRPVYGIDHAITAAVLWYKNYYVRNLVMSASNIDTYTAMYERRRLEDYS